MDATTIKRYQPPDGDIYATLVKQYGQASADSIAAAAATGDNNGEVNTAIANARTAAGLTKGQQDDSTLDAFGNQLATDPFGAPLGFLENIVGNTFLSFLKNPWVTALAVGILFFALGGWAVLKKQLAKLA